MIVVAGRLPQPATIAFLGPSPKLVPVRPVAFLQAFPGLHQGRMLLVVDKSELPANGVGPVISLWVKGDPEKVGAAVRAAHIPVLTEVSAKDVEATPDFLALTWTFGFLQALGVLTGLIALGCTFLYLEARQRAREVSYALSKRMGLSRGAHRRSVVVEIGAMLVVGFVVGVGLALIASRSMFRKVDPLPKLPPAPLFRAPLALLGVTGLALLAVAWIVSWRVQRVAERADVAQVMRLAD